MVIGHYKFYKFVFKVQIFDTQQHFCNILIFFAENIKQQN